MRVCRITCIALVLGVNLLAGIAESGSGIQPRGFKNCEEVFRSGDQFEGYFALFPEVSTPNEYALVYCGTGDGMLPRNSSVPKSNPKNCQDLKENGMTDSGINIIYPYADHHESPVIVYCEQEFHKGGWTVIQRRDDYDIQLDFYRTFEEYAFGFGNVGNEFWLGNSIIHELTQQGVNELYVDMKSFEGVTKHARYDIFDVGPNSEKKPYMLTVAHYSGDAGDSLFARHDGMAFTTLDADHDVSTGNCAVNYKGGWWYSNCHASNLNGIYYEDGKWEDKDAKAACWHSFSNSSESLQRIVMLTRPLNQHRTEE